MLVTSGLKGPRHGRCRCTVACTPFAPMTPDLKPESHMKTLPVLLPTGSLDLNKDQEAYRPSRRPTLINGIGLLCLARPSAPRTYTNNYAFTGTPFKLNIFMTAPISQVKLLLLHNSVSGFAFVVNTSMYMYIHIVKLSPHGGTRLKSMDPKADRAG